MNIAFIAGGRLPIPPNGWGAIETLIWNYKEYLEKLGHSVEIYNSTWLGELAYDINNKHHDFIHLEWDLFTSFFNKHIKQPFCVTSHCGGFSKFKPGGSYYPWFESIYEDLLEAPGNIVLSDQIANLMKKSKYNGFLYTLRNPVESNRFAFKSKGNGKAICLGRIVPRKRQALISTLLNNNIDVDFVGPFTKEEVPEFTENTTCKYIGNWDRQTVYDHLTDYSCLILLSESEAAPLVVPEGLSAGLSIVVSEYSAANLGTFPFIHVIKENDIQTLSAITSKAIKENLQYRKDIRDYAFSWFNYPVVVNEYVEVIEKFKSFTSHK